MTPTNATMLPARTSSAVRLRTGWAFIAADYGFGIGNTYALTLSQRSAGAVGLAGLLVLAAACSSGGPPAPSPSPSAALTSPSPSPQPLQRVEKSLPAPVEETAAAAAGGRLYVMGGFNAAGASLNTVYVFDGTTWSLGPRLPLPLDHPSAATL